MVRTAICLILAAQLALTPAAQADPGCWGCNVADAGQFSSSLVGRTVYVEASGSGFYGTVTYVDTYARRVYVRKSNGTEVWASPSIVYSSKSRDERVGTTAAAGAVGIALLACALGACSNNNTSSNRGYSSSQSSSGSARNNTWQQEEMMRRNQSPPPPPPPPKPDTSTGCAWGDRSTGTCH